MSLPPQEISFSAGAEAPSPSKCRVVEQDAQKRLSQIGEAFPGVRRILASWPVLIQAYPAPLGLRGANATLVDTYLREVTVQAAFEWAVLEDRDAVFVAQPLAGAEFLFRATSSTLPRRILWAVGGYYLPASLEQTVVEHLRERGCGVHLLHSYGVAEVAHTCFAATERDPNGLPKYRKVADEIDAHITAINQEDVGRLNLKGPQNEISVDTGDFATVKENVWTIFGGAQRLAAPLRALLESWTSAQWLRRTGYLRASQTEICYQLRAGCVDNSYPQEIPYYRYQERYHESLLSKPDWRIH